MGGVVGVVEQAKIYLNQGKEKGYFENVNVGNAQFNNR